MPTQNQFVAQRQLRRTNGPTYDFFGCGIVILIVGSRLNECDNECRGSYSSACASRSLLIVRRAWWNASQKYRLQIAKIHAELERRRAAQNIDLAILGGMAILKSLLIFGRQSRTELCRVLSCRKR